MRGPSSGTPIKVQPIQTNLTKTYFSRGWPGEAMASFCNLVVMRVRSASFWAEARRLRRVVILC